MAGGKRLGGPVVGFFGGFQEYSKQEAIEFIKRNGWTQEDVKLILHGNDYVVVAKRRLW